MDALGGGLVFSGVTHPSKLASAAVAATALIVVSVAAAVPPPPAPGARVAILGGTAAERELARLTALRVAGPTVKRIAFRPVPRVLRQKNVRGTELVILSRNRESLRAEWEQELYAAAYVALSARWPLAAIAAVASAHSERPVDRVPALDVFSRLPTALAVAEQHRSLVEAASARGARVVELRTAAAPARAIAVVLRVDDPAAFLKDRAASFLALLNKPRIPLLGFYVAVQDASGRLVWATSRLPNMGGVFVIPRLDACSPVSHGGIVGATPPPCPAK